jgi:hypothetical protein
MAMGLRRGGGALPPQGDGHAAQGTCARWWGPRPGGSSRGQGGSRARQPAGRPRHAAAPPPEAAPAGAVRAWARGRAPRRWGRGAGERGATSLNPRNCRKRRTRMEELTGEEDLRRSRSQICRLPEIRGSNRRTERSATKPSTRRTQRYPRILQTMHGLGVIARRSCRRSLNRSELRRAIPGARDQIWRKRFVFWNGLDEMKLDMYIYLGFG